MAELEAPRRLVDLVPDDTLGFYNLESAEGERTIARLRGLGHRVAHHAAWPHLDLD